MDAALVTSWKSICHIFAPALAGPTLTSPLQVLAGWVLCRSKPTVTNLVRTIGPRLPGVAAQHWSHNWVIGAAALRCKRFSSWVTALPVRAALYRKKKDCDASLRC